MMGFLQRINKLALKTVLIGEKKQISSEISFENSSRIDFKD